MAGQRLYLGRVRRALSLLADAVFPRRCVRCGDEGDLLCQMCTVDWTPSKPEILFFKSGGLNGLFSSFYYADPVANRLIRSWKYHFDQTAWKHLQLAVSMNDTAIEAMIDSGNFDCVVPVSLHPRRYCERGFDQSIFIARMIQERYSVDAKQLLIRKRFTGTQADRDPKQRREEMKQNPFICNESSPVPETILLVDDVWTTGSTAKAAADVLKKAGAKKIWIYTLAKG